MILNITDDKYLRDYQPSLKFNNGVEGIVDLVSELWGTVFEPLKDLALFSQVKLDKELSTVAWPSSLYTSAYETPSFWQGCRNPVTWM